MTDPVIDYKRIGAAQFPSPYLRPVGGYNAFLAADPRFAAWFSAKRGRVAPALAAKTSGPVATLSCRKGSGLTMIEPLTNPQPQFVWNGGPRGTRGAIQFGTSGSKKLTLSGGALAVGVDRFMACIFKSAGATSTKYLARSTVGVGDMLFNLGAAGGGSQPNQVFFRVSSGGSQAIINLPFTPGEWCLAEACWVEDTKTVWLSVNGGAWASNTNAGAVLTQTDLVMGAGLLTTTDYIMELWPGYANLTDPANADARKVLKAYAKDMAGASV